MSKQLDILITMVDDLKAKVDNQSEEDTLNDLYEIKNHIKYLINELER